MSSKRIAALVLLAASLPVSALAADKAPKCKWDGEAKDAFSGADGRWLRFTRYSVSFVAHPVVDGRIALDIGVPVGGLVKDDWTEPWRFLLADKTVVEVPLPAPASGVISSNGYGPITSFVLKLSIDVATAQRMLEIGVIQDKITPPPPIAAISNEWDKGDTKNFGHILDCSLNGV